LALDPERYQGLAGFRFALRRFIAASETINRQAGITQQQYQALLAIKTRPAEAMPMKELAEQLLLTHHAAVQLVNRLAKLDLAERRPSKDDRRSVLLKPTRKGEDLLDDLASKHLEEMQRQAPLLTQSLARLRRMGN
jgi:DNA-binding MarR family transcriptional regulator